MRVEVRGVLEQRAKAPPRGSHVVQVLFGRVVNKAPARPFQRASLVPNGLRQPLHSEVTRCGAFDEGISADLRELTLQT